MRHRKPYELPRPVRPHVPVLALAALPFWGASAAAYTLCRTADSAGIAILGCLLAVASLALAALAFMIFTQLYTPCMTALGTIKKETQSWKWMAFAFIYTCAVAWVASLIVYQGGKLLGFE